MTATVTPLRATTDERPEPFEWFSVKPVEVRHILDLARLRGGDVHSATWDRHIANTPSLTPHTDALVELGEWLARIEDLDCGVYDHEFRTLRAAENKANALRDDCVRVAQLIASLIKQDTR